MHLEGTVQILNRLSNNYHVNCVLTVLKDEMNGENCSKHSVGYKIDSFHLGVRSEENYSAKVTKDIHNIILFSET